MNKLRHQEREEMKALTRKLADAQATVEALQRERDEANLYRDQARANQESLAACVDRDVRKIKDHSCHVSGCERDDLQQLRDENTRLTNEIKRRIWILHGSRLTHNLYGDDGNMDCNSCFRRYAEATLEQCYDWEIADAAMIVTKAALDGGKGVQGGGL